MKIFLNCKLTNDIKYEIKKNLNDLECGLSLQTLNDFDINSTNISYIEFNSKIIAFCIHSEINTDILISDLNYDCEDYEQSDYEDLKDFLLSLDKNTIYIHFIESIEKGYGYGQLLLNEILKFNKDIILYSRVDSRSFWLDNDFINIFGNEFIYQS